ncbi:hypothetical protein KAR91_68320, partial [Candidatus Pacearchaeota archaeon]|nr:hypothetical protein [Candidatus Pacearchaeota archaeon]
MGNPVPTQLRSIDPFASYNSNIASRLTRIVTDGKDCVLFPSPIDASLVNTTTVRATTGKCVKDDILIEIQDIDVIMTDPDFYADSGGGVWNETGYHYLVLDYQYTKVKPAPLASVKIIMPSQRVSLFKATSNYLFLKCLNITDPGGGKEVTELLDFDPEDPTISRVVQGANPEATP